MNAAPIGAWIPVEHEGGSKIRVALISLPQSPKNRIDIPLDLLHDFGLRVRFLFGVGGAGIINLCVLAV